MHAALKIDPFFWLMNSYEQNLKFLVNLGKIYQEIHEIFRTLYEDNLKKPVPFKWIKLFNENHEDGSARTTFDGTAECVRSLVQNIRDWNNCILKLLTPGQKLKRAEYCIDWKTSLQISNFLQSVITWCDIELKSQREKWKKMGIKNQRHAARSFRHSKCCTPCDFFLFPKRKMVMWGRHWNAVETWNARRGSWRDLGQGSIFPVVRLIYPEF